MIEIVGDWLLIKKKNARCNLSEAATFNNYQQQSKVRHWQPVFKINSWSFQLRKHSLSCLRLQVGMVGLGEWGGGTSKEALEPRQTQMWNLNIRILPEGEKQKQKLLLCIMMSKGIWFSSVPLSDWPGYANFSRLNWQTRVKMRLFFFAAPNCKFVSKYPRIDLQRALYITKEEITVWRRYKAQIFGSFKSGAAVDENTFI